jgi:hypothetical protein
MAINIKKLLCDDNQWKDKYGTQILHEWQGNYVNKIN